MKPLINYLQSEIGAKRVLYLCDSPKNIDQAYKNVAINLEKAGIRTIPLTKQCIRLKDGTQIFFFPVSAGLEGRRFNFAIVDGFVDRDYIEEVVKTRLYLDDNKNIVLLGGGMSEIRDYARTEAMKRLV